MGYLFIWITFALIVTALAISKGRRGAIWLVYGLLLCPLAVVHVVFARPRLSDAASGRQKCPNCAVRIPVEARTCRHCHHSLPEEWAATWRAS